jgi:hypothetical protein
VRIRFALVAATLFGFAACGSGSTVTVSSATTAPASEMATCGGDDQAFPVEVLTDAAPAESVIFGDSPGAALQAFLEAGGDPGGGGFIWTGGEWLVLHRGETRVQYAYRSERLLAYANSDLKSAGWNVSNYGTCQPQIVGASPWRIHGSVDRAASYVTISYSPLTSCHEAVPTEADVTVTETESEVGLLLRLTPEDPAPNPSEPEACPAIGVVHDPIRKRVELDAPLGNRVLLDYGTVGHTPPK